MDIENKRPAPPPVFRFEARRGRSTSDPTVGGQVGFTLGRSLTARTYRSRVDKRPLLNISPVISSKWRTSCTSEWRTANALAAKVHGLSVANRLPESGEPACAQKISQQIGARTGAMVARLERQDFSDVERLFGQLCESNGSPSTAELGLAGK